ncbi:hypothetical protein EII23_02530 [Desulfovibrio sp. OH1186_COT-070]|nr:hypothetical protein EII24_02530 [Desulfovibrio sp. OH1209_COT-279]RRD88009.1 hypothetical protein EII23_02530 [Desulfovibrio sp. OH1186_COT-070]
MLPGAGFAALCLAFFLAGCATRQAAPLTFEQEQARAAHEQCRREATEMNPEGRHFFRESFPWRAYYDMCMRRMGVAEQDIRKMR